MTRTTKTSKSPGVTKTPSNTTKSKAAVARPVRDDFIDYLVDSLAELGPIETKRFFSGTGLLLDGTQFAFVIRGTLWMRVDETGRQAFLAVGSQPFTYRTSKREVALNGYYAVPASMLEDTDELCDWTRRAFHVALADREMKAAHVKTRPRKSSL